MDSSASEVARLPRVRNNCTCVRSSRAAVTISAEALADLVLAQIPAAEGYEPVRYARRRSCRPVAGGEYLRSRRNGYFSHRFSEHAYSAFDVFPPAFSTSEVR
jgi:hypothetical protein